MFLIYGENLMFEFANELSTVLVRLGLAVLLSGIIGIERGKSRHPAGMRTHILVCVGACLVMLTNAYLHAVYGGASDPGRFGAQVVTGVGFLGVGTILMTGNKIKGLTTAAGLWASAALGLAIGAGFYSAAVVAAVLIFISLGVLDKSEDFLYKRSRLVSLYVEMRDFPSYREFMKGIKAAGIKIHESHVSQAPGVLSGSVPFFILLERPRKKAREAFIVELNDIDGVYIIEEV